MNIKINLLILTIIAAAMTSCSDSNSIFEEDSKKYQNATGTSDAENKIPMRFYVNNIAELSVSSMTTRADETGLIEPSIIGKEIGLFVILDTDYQRAQQGLELKSGFRYSNIRGIVQSDGSIEIPDTTIYHPLYQQSQMAVIAYSPYRADMPDSVLYKGEMFRINDNQTVSDLMFDNDLLVGTPTIGNPFRVTPPLDLTPQTVSLTFSHAYCRLIVDVELPYGEENLTCENISVNMNNIPLEARVNILSETIETDATTIGSVEMLNTPYTSGTIKNDVISYRATAIIFPQQYDNQFPPEIAIKLDNRPNERPDTTIVRQDVHYTDFIKGHDVRYSVRIGL